MSIQSIIKSLSKLRLGKIVIAVALLANLGLGAVTPVSANNTCHQFYVVQYGDTLAKIAARYGTTWVDLAANNNIANANYIYAGQHICVDGYSTTVYGTGGAVSTAATLTISNVFADRRFTINTFNFPNRERYTVLLAPYGMLSSSAVRVGTLITDLSDGEMSQTYKIPDSLKGETRFSLRLKSVKSGQQFDRWFYNSAIGTGGATVVSTAMNFSISRVVYNKTITLSFVNLRANERYRVYIGAYGSHGEGGTQVGSFKLSSGKTYSATYSLPAEIKGSKKFDVLLVNVPTGNSVYHTVKNVTNP